MMSARQINSRLSLNFYRKGCSDGGMVDTKDLKSFDYCSCAGSSPAPSTQGSFSVLLESSLFLYLELIFLRLYYPSFGYWLVHLKIRMPGVKAGHTLLYVWLGQT